MIVSPNKQIQGAGQRQLEEHVIAEYIIIGDLIGGKRIIIRIIARIKRLCIAERTVMNPEIYRRLHAVIVGRLSEQAVRTSRK